MDSISLRWEICVNELTRACQHYFEKLVKTSKDKKNASAFFAAGEGVKTFKESLAKISKYTPRAQKKLVASICKQLASYHPEFDILNTFKICVLDVVRALGATDIVNDVQVHREDLEATIYKAMSNLSLYVHTHAHAFFHNSPQYMDAIESKMMRIARTAVQNTAQKILHRSLEIFGAPATPAPALRTPHQASTAFSAPSVPTQASGALLMPDHHDANENAYEIEN